MDKNIKEIVMKECNEKMEETKMTEKKKTSFDTTRRSFLKGLTVAPTAAYLGSMAMSMGRVGTVGAIGAIGGITTLTSCSRPGTPGDIDIGDIGVNPDLATHSAEFEKKVIEVTDGVYVAIGYGLANSIMIEGDDGVVIVDTMESVEAAEEAKAEFDKITTKPVKGIIYTHNHVDHIFGSKVFAGDDNPDVYSHESTIYYIDRILNVIRPIIYKRSVGQFGTFLPPGGVINAGIGPRLLVGDDYTASLIRPTKTFAGDRMDVEIAGIKLELYHAPGETPDQIFVYLPDRGILLPGDNFYKSFPNLYAIRGTAYRDVTLWVKSLDKMRAKRPKFLVPSHTKPIIGADEIFETLTNYRDAIQFVHDQTVKGMNERLTPDELVERVKLPPHLANQPYLFEYYGTVEWSVRSIYDGYLGWFNGNATNLFPLPNEERAKRISDLCGGVDVLIENAKEALEVGDNQWVLELTDIILNLDSNNKEVLDIRADALTALGEAQITATARNYYLTQALETTGKIEINDRKVKEKDILYGIPLTAIFNSMAVTLNAEKSADTNTVVGFRFPDVGEAFTLHVRRSICEVQPVFPKSPDVTVTVDSTIWKEIVAGLRSPAVALAKGNVKVEGGTLNLVKFLGQFDKN